MKLFKSSKLDNQPSRRRENVAVQNQEPTARRQAFRRNQTLTGSSSARISSSAELSAQMVSPRAHVHHLSRTRRSIMLRLVAVIIAGLLLYLLVSQLVATVSVKIIGSAVTNDQQQMYEKRIDTYYAAHPVERFYPSLNQSSLTKYLQTAFPEIEKAQIDLTGQFGKGLLTLQLRTPIVRWTINGKNEFVDKNGVVFDYNIYGAPAVEIVDKSGTSQSAQGVVTSRRFLGFVGMVVGDMQAKGYIVTQATIPPLTTRQLEITIKDVPYNFKLTLDRSAGEQTEDAARVREYLTQKGITPQYVDVRVSGRAFYK